MNKKATRTTHCERRLITFAVMSAAVMQVLDTTIVNVALPHMQGSLGALPDQISWVLTSYLISSAIFMPLTGYLTDRLGRKNYLLLSIAGFVLVSALCGLATSIGEIVFFRLLQGVFGAALVPLSQAILADTYPKEQQGRAMAIWGVGIMVGPILGPTLGGYLTEVASWRWTFYINVPFGMLSLFLAWQVVPDTPKKDRNMDWVGLAFISLAIGATQYVLDRGNNDDWFNGKNIVFAAFLAVLGLITFVSISFHKKDNTVFDVSIFKDRNFLVASIVLAIFGLGMYGSMIIQPLLLEDNLGYPVLTAGLAMAPRGIGGFISMLFVGKIIHKYDPRYLIGLGIIITAISNWIGTSYSLMISPNWITFPLFLQGLGLGLIFVPLSTVAFSTLPHTMRAEGAGLYSLLRTIGSSVGISLVITMFSRHTQIHWNDLSGDVTPYNLALLPYETYAPVLDNLSATMELIGGSVARQAQMAAFVDVYAFITWSFVLMLPLILLIRYKQPEKGEDLPVGEF